MSNSLSKYADPYECQPESFSGKIIAIDGNIQLYKFLTAMRRNGDLIRNSNDEPISHLLGMFNRTTSLLAHDMKPMYVFDGGYPDLKSGEVADRAQDKEDAQAKFEEAKAEGDTDAMEKWGPRTARITDQIQSETETLLDCLGVPYLNAPSEADPQIARMVSDGVADYAGTEDFDTMVHGADAMIRGLGKDGGNVVSLNQVLDATNLEYHELVWACIGSGTDYNESPYRVAWGRATNMAEEADTWEEFIDLCLERDDSINVERWHEVKAWFDDPNVTDDYEMEFREPSHDLTMQFLNEQKGIGSTQVQNALEEL